MRGPTSWGDGESCPRGGCCLKSASLATRCLTARKQWAVQLLQCTASLPGSSGQCNSCDSVPHCLGAVGSATPATHSLTAWAQWAVQLLQRTASLPGGSGQWNSCNARPHCLGAVGSGAPAMRGPTSWGDGEAYPGGGCCLKSASPATRCLTAREQWAAELLQCIASLPGGSGQCNSCNALPYCPGAMGTATPAVHCHTASGRWEVGLLQYVGPPAGGTGSPAQEAAAAQIADLLQCIATLPWGSGQRNSCHACTASLPGGNAQCNSCNTVPHCLGAVGIGTPATHCLIA